MRSDFSYTQHSLSVSGVLIFTLYVALILVNSSKYCKTQRTSKSWWNYNSDDE